MIPPWCVEGDSNSHGLPHWNLNPARLPVPPSTRCNDYEVDHLTCTVKLAAPTSPLDGEAQRLHDLATDEHVSVIAASGHGSIR